MTTKLLPPSGRIAFRGVVVDRRTAHMVLWAERQAGFFFTITQGSFNAGKVAASAGTHDGAGAIDCSVRGLTVTQRNAMVKALKDAGFAAWYRTPIKGLWPAHVHAIAIPGPTAPDRVALAPLARVQVKAYDNRRDGLKANAVDKSYRPTPPVSFHYVKGKPVPRKP